MPMGAFGLAKAVLRVAASLALVSASGWAFVLASVVLLVSAGEASAVQECQASGCS